MLIVQVNTLRDGSRIEGARWEIKSLTNVREGHHMQVSLPTSDVHVISYVKKQAKQELGLEKDENKGKNAHSVILKFVVKEIRHLLDTTTSDMDTMVTLVPVDRVVEGVLTYLLHPEKCDPRWVQVMRGSATANPT